MDFKRLNEELSKFVMDEAQPKLPDWWDGFINKWKDIFNNTVICDGYYLNLYVNESYYDVTVDIGFNKPKGFDKVTNWDIPLLGVLVRKEVIQQYKNPPEWFTGHYDEQELEKFDLFQNPEIKDELEIYFNLVRNAYKKYSNIFDGTLDYYKKWEDKQYTVYLRLGKVLKKHNNIFTKVTGEGVGYLRQYSTWKDNKIQRVGGVKYRICVAGVPSYRYMDTINIDWTKILPQDLGFFVDDKGVLNLNCESNADLGFDRIQKLDNWLTQNETNILEYLSTLK